MVKNELIYIEHILDAIEKIEKYTVSVDVYEFIDNDMMHDAVIRNFEIIGEATKNISISFRSKHPKIPWKKMTGMRDILIHDYLGIDMYAVWETITENLPELKDNLHNLLTQK